MRYPAALLGHVSLRDCSMAQNEGSHWKQVRRGRHPRPLLGVTRAPASFAHCDQGSTRFIARGMIARVVRLPAFRAGLKNELAQRFCCRCPACDPSTRRLPRLRSQPSSRCRRFVTSISCHPDAFLQRRCFTSSSSCFCCGRAPLPACAVPWLPRHVLLHF